MLTTTTTTLHKGIATQKSPQTNVQPLIRGIDDTPETSIPQINLSYDGANSESSTLNLIYRIQPKWREFSEQIELTKFTDGITNTLFRIARRRPGATQEEVDEGSILMRAYGNNTDLIIDRDREARSHALLAARGMAPPLLARFNNGLLYKYIAGKSCSPDDLTREQIWRGVASKLAEWHARVPISTVTHKIQLELNGTNGHQNGKINGDYNACLAHRKLRKELESRSPEPNMWSVLQQWVDILPVGTEKERARKELLQHEIERTFQDLDTREGFGDSGFVFGHLDLLSGNVIMLPTKPDATTEPSNALPVTFIDYEYATPCPAAMDIANHFAEWAGFDLDYSRLPTRAVRREFLAEYAYAYGRFSSVQVSESTIDALEEQVDRWRGIPGLWWGIWALIQATISQIDFDYASYAEERLDEYWAWRAESSGTRASTGKALPLREQRWAQES